MPACEHSDVCGRGALDGHDGKCILHSEDPEKDGEAFEEALGKHREEHGPDFRWMVFPRKIDFSGAIFEVRANFGGATFESKADFGGVTFEREATFAGATFGASNFSEATFGEWGDFRRAVFKDDASFQDTTFEDEANFLGATFEEEADFAAITFEVRANFGGATFESKANFGGVTFEGEATFRGTTFEKDAVFTSATFTDVGDFQRAIFENEATFRGATFEDVGVFTRATFTDVSFEYSSFLKAALFIRSFETGDEVQLIAAAFTRCKFEAEAIFAGESENNRAFAGGEVSFRNLTVGPDASLQFRYADLSHCRFLRTDLRDVEFTGVQWCKEVSRSELFSRDGLYEEIAEESENGERWVDRNPGENEKQRPWPEIERLYRELKKNYEEKGDFPRAGDFHIGEKEARRRNPNTNCPIKALLWTYRALSKFGERALPATFWLIGLVPVFAFVYFLIGASTCSFCEPVSYPEAFLTSMEATFYPVRPVGFVEFWPQFLSIVQRVFSPVLLALLALALRQRVKR